MFLIEPERGCSRDAPTACDAPDTNGACGRAARRVLELIPEGARRVGLVGAAVTDHPRIVELVRTLVDDGRQVGISSLRRTGSARARSSSRCSPAPERGR